MSIPAETIPAETIPAETIPADVQVLAVVVARDGQLPAGAAETVAEAGGAALVAGSGTAKAADGLPAARRVWLLEVVFGRCRPRWPARWRRCWRAWRWSCCQPHRTAVISRPGWP